MNLNRSSTFSFVAPLPFFLPSQTANPPRCTPSPQRRIRINSALRNNVNSNNVMPDVSVEAPTPIKDGPFGQFAIAQFRRIMSPEIGWTSSRPGYDGMVEEMRMLLAKKPPIQQQRVVFKTLDTLFQAPYGTSVFRRYFSQHAQLNARITPIFFRWLVGPCHYNIPDDQIGHGVYIEKCRFLDESGCKGLCVNMCQQPTQRYFTEVLGLPVRMTPDYENKSCQMTFGRHPLPVNEDPAVTGDCLVNCKMAGSFKKRGEDTCYVTKDTRPSQP